VRRYLLTVPVLLLVAAGCGREAVLTPPMALSSSSSPTSTVLRIADPTGVSLLDTEAAEVLTRIRGGVRSRDWVFQTRLTPDGTTVSAISGRGEVAWQQELDGELAARVASSDGSRLALLPFGDGWVDPYNPVGRRTTELTIVPTDGGDVRQYDLDGNYEPEAFSTSGRSLFVVEYTPPEAPETYRVRKLDLDTGEVGPVYSADGDLQQSMRGTARVQALSADGTRLYTLYTTDAPHGALSIGATQAFVHVLDLKEEWAHCVDLPAPIGSSPENLLAIAAAPNDDRVVVVDALAGVAELDTVSLTVGRTIELALSSTQPGRAMAALGRDGTLFTGLGTSISVLDADLAARTIQVAPATMLGLYVDPRDDRIWTLGPEELYALDPTTGRVVATAALTDDTPRLDVPAPYEDAPMKCAC
jgi:hypothetical protein